MQSLDRRKVGLQIRSKASKISLLDTVSTSKGLFLAADTQQPEKICGPFAAVDVGTKRVGITFCDAEGRLLERPTSVTRAKSVAEEFLLKHIAAYQIRTLVAGLPLDEQDRRTTQCADVEKFCRRIERRAGVRVEYVDEYLSSIEAQEKFDDLDAGAAYQILKRFLRLQGMP